MKRAVLLSAICLTASVAPAADIAFFSDQSFDQAIAPTVEVQTSQDGYMPVLLQAWVDPTLGPQALDVELRAENGTVLRRLTDIAPPSPFAPGIKGQLLVPVTADTRSLRFRVRGDGPTAGSWNLWPTVTDGTVLTRSGENRLSRDLQIEDGGRALVLFDQDKRIGRLELGPGWQMSIAVPPRGCSFSEPCTTLFLSGSGGELGTMEARFPIRNPNWPVASPPIRLALDLRGSRARAFTLTFQPEGSGSWLLPFNQGLRVPSDQAASLNPGYDLALRAGHFVSMPGFGWDNGDTGFVMASTTPADEAWRLRLQDRQLTWVFLPSQGVWDLHRFVLGVCAPGAKAWSVAYQQGIEEIPAHTGMKKRPRLPWTSLAGAVNIHYWKKVAWWNNEPHPEQLAAEMKASGLERVLWSQKVVPEAVTPMAQLGWLLGSYENFQDLYPAETPLSWVNKDGWPEQAVLDRWGRWVKGWPHKDGGKTYYAGVRSSRAAVDYVRKEIAARKQHGQHAVFLDTTTASGPVEDWNPLHPMTRMDDMRHKREQLVYGRDLGLLVGSESGHDGALGAAHYFEGMQSPWVGRFEDSGYDLGTIKPATEAMKKWNLSPRYRAPLFDLAYHDRYVGYEYWGDAANRLPEHWRRKDLFSVLYGQPQLWVMDEERWKTQKAQAIKSYRTWSPVVRHLFGQRMTDWKILDKVGDVQETHWEDGSIVRVDFAQDTIVLEGPLRQAVGPR